MGKSIIRKLDRQRKIREIGMKKKKTTKEKLLKLDFGCGPNTKEGFEGVDILPFDGKVKHVMNLVEPEGSGYKKWPWADNSVEEAYSAHFLEHLEPFERVHFVNELYRILIPDGKATIIVPYWASSRAYGDPSHRFPPVSEFWFYYLNQAWRLQEAPHTDIKHIPNGFNCNFEATWGYGMLPSIQARNQEFQQFAVQFYKEAVQDLFGALIKR